MDWEGGEPIVESYRHLKVPVRDYLAAILAGLAVTSAQRLAELTPAAWVAQKREALRVSTVWLL
jgi:hypothetical protein